MIKILDNLFSRKFFISFAVLYCCFKSYPYIPYTKYTTFLLVIYGSLFFIYRILRNRQNLIFADMFFAYFYFAISIVSFIINGMKMEQGFYKTCVEFFSLFSALFLYMPRDINDTNNDLKKDFDYLMKFLGCVTLIIGIFNITSMFFPKSFTIDKSNPLGFVGERFLSRFTGILGNANRLGQFAISCIPSCLYIIYIYIKKFDKNKVLYYVASINLFVQVISCVLSGSRATYLNLFLYLILFIYLIFKKNNEKIKKYRNIIIVLIFVLIIGCLIFYLMTRGFSFKINDRLGLYIIAISMFLHNNILFGSSFGRYMENWYTSMNQLIVKNDFYKGLSMHAFNPHNTYLRALCLHGIFGFIIIISLFIYTFYRAIKLLKTAFNSNDSLLNIMIIILFMYFINAIMGTISDGLVLTNNLWMINNLMSMVAIGYIAQLYYNMFLVKNNG